MKETLFRKDMISVVANKANRNNELSDSSKRYVNLTGLEIAKECIKRSGANVNNLNKNEIVERAFHSTSDLPSIMMDASNKSLQKEYKEKPQSFEFFTDRVSHSDFKLQNKVQLGNAPGLEKLGENGEVKYGTLNDSENGFKLETYAKGLTFGRQMLINDDLSALDKIPRSWARKIRQLESGLVWDLILQNVQLADGKSLFHTDHNNLITVGSPLIDVASIAAIEKLLMTQTDIDGEEIELEAKKLMVPVARKAEAMQFLSSSFVPTKKADVNPFRGNIEAGWDSKLDKISAEEYFLFASKEQVSMCELATLDGRGPEISQAIEFDTLGMKMKIVYDVAAGIVDHRGFYKVAKV